MSMSIKTRLIPLLGGVCLLAAACGSGSTSASTSSKSSPTTGSSASSATVTVTIGKAVNVEDLLAINIAQQQGFFKGSGVNVKTEVLSGSSVANAALQGGSTQFSAASATSVLLAASKGIPLLAVGAFDQGDPAQLVVSNSWIKKHGLSPSQPLAQRIKGLTGSTFAALSTTDTAVLKGFEQLAGVSSSAIHSVSITSESAMLTAVQHNEAQEFIASPPTSNLAVGEGIGAVLAKASELPLLNDEEYNVLITTPAYAKAHPKVVAAVSAGLAKALALMSSGNQQAITAVKNAFPTLSTSVIKSSLGTFDFAAGMKQSQKAWQDALTAATQTGVIKSASSVNISSGGVWTNQYLANG